MPVRLIHATANRPPGGAIAILQLIGDSCAILRELTGIEHWPLCKLRLATFDNIDEGLAVRLNKDVAQLMPHGGPRVIQRLTARLIELGAAIVHEEAKHQIDPCQLYPEAADRYEALMLAALARAQSPLAIDLLLDQPWRWREFSGRFTNEDRARSARLNRLIDPPIVVLAGRPNVGKSTLSNALLGRSMSIAYDQPGTTRDYTAGRIELAGLVVDWHDTPGIRQTSDAIEAKAIKLARGLIDRADILIAMADSKHDWPDLPRKPDLRVMNKADLIASAPTEMSISAVLHVSAKTGAGLHDLVRAVRDALVPPTDLEQPGVWLFDERLLQCSIGSK